MANETHRGPDDAPSSRAAHEIEDGDGWLLGLWYGKPIAWHADPRWAALLRLIFRIQVGWMALVLVGTLLAGTLVDQNAALLFLFVVTALQIVLLPLTAIALGGALVTGAVAALQRRRTAAGD